MTGIQVSSRSSKPIYQQLYEQISSRILKGELAADFGLPSIRTAAKELRVSIITVKKAWEELERSGLIYTVSGKGCFVAELSKDERQQKRQEILKVQMEKDLEFYKSFDVTEQEMKGLLQELFQE